MIAVDGDTSLRIIDAQVHAWAHGDSTGHHRRSPITRDVLTGEMSQAGVDRVVLVPPLWDKGGNAYSLQLAQAEPDRFAVMGVLDPLSEDLPGQLRHLNSQPGVVGVRFLLNTPERVAPLRDGRLEPVFPIAQAQGMVVALLVPGALDEVDRLAQAYSGLDIIVDHLGVPRGATGPAAFDHLPDLLALARHPRVHVKAAAVGDYALDPYPFRSLDDILRQVFDAFGPDRLLWASDLSRLHHPYRECVDHFAQMATWLSPHDLALVMGGNASRLFRWP